MANEIPFEDAREHHPPARRWLILVSFCYFSFWNAFLFMDFATVPDIAKSKLDIGENALNWLYSSSLVTVTIGSLPAMLVLERYGQLVLALGVVADVAAAWLRWLTVRESSYALGVASSICIGLGGAAIITWLAPLGDTYFPRRSRLLATTLAVQLNYAGWMLGSWLVPVLVTDEESLLRSMFWQAVAVSISVLIFAVLHRPPPSPPAAAASNAPLLEGKEGSLAAVVVPIGSLGKNMPFVVRWFCYSVLGGISFAVPAVQAELLDDLVHADTKNTNLSFLASGVLTGLALGALVDRRVRWQEPKRLLSMLRALFVLAAVAITLLAIVVSNPELIRGRTALPVLLVLMAFAGAGGLGFISLGLREAVGVARPVSEVYSGGAVMLSVQLWGVLFTQVYFGGFIVCAVGAWISAVPLVLFARPKST